MTRTDVMIYSRHVLSGLLGGYHEHLRQRMANYRLGRSVAAAVKETSTRVGFMRRVLGT